MSDDDGFFDDENPFAGGASGRHSHGDGEAASSSLHQGADNDDGDADPNEASQRHDFDGGDAPSGGHAAAPAPSTFAGAAASFTSLFTPDRIVFDNEATNEDEVEESRIPDLPVDRLPPGTRVWVCPVREVRVLGQSIWTADLIPYCGSGIPGTVVRHSKTGATTVVRFEHRADFDFSDVAVFGEHPPGIAVAAAAAAAASPADVVPGRVCVSLSFPRAALALVPPLRPPGAKSMNPNGGNNGAGMKFGLDPRGGPSIPKRLNNGMVKHLEHRTLTDFDRDATVSSRDDLRDFLGRLADGDLASARVVPVPPPAKMAVDSLLHLFEMDCCGQDGNGCDFIVDEPHEEMPPPFVAGTMEEGLCATPPRWVKEAGARASATSRLRAWRGLLACGDAAAARAVTQALPDKVPASVRDFVAAVNAGEAAVRAAVDASCGAAFRLRARQTYEFGRTLHCGRYLVRGDVVAAHACGPLAVAVTGADLPACANCCAAMPAPPASALLAAGSKKRCSNERFGHREKAAAGQQQQQQQQHAKQSGTQHVDVENVFFLRGDRAPASTHPLVPSAPVASADFGEQVLEAQRSASGWIGCPRGSSSIFCSPRCVREAWHGFHSVERGGRDCGRVFRTVFGFLQFQATHFSDEIRAALLLLVRCCSIVFAELRRGGGGAAWSEQQLRVAFARLGAFPAPTAAAIEGDLLKFIRATLHPSLLEALDAATEAPALTVELLVAVFCAVFQFQRILPVHQHVPSISAATTPATAGGCGASRPTDEDSEEYSCSGDDDDFEEEEEEPSGGGGKEKERVSSQSGKRSASLRGRSQDSIVEHDAGGGGGGGDDAPQRVSPTPFAGNEDHPFASSDKNSSAARGSDDGGGGDEDSDDGFFTSTPPNLSASPTTAVSVSSMTSASGSQSQMLVRKRSNSAAAALAAANRSFRMQQLAMAAEAADKSNNSLSQATTNKSASALLSSAHLNRAPGSGSSEHKQHMTGESSGKEDGNPVKKANADADAAAAAAGEEELASRRKVAVLTPLCSCSCKSADKKLGGAANCRLVLLETGHVALLVTADLIPKGDPLECEA